MSNIYDKQFNNRVKLVPLLKLMKKNQDIISAQKEVVKNGGYKGKQLELEKRYLKYLNNTLI